MGSHRSTMARKSHPQQLVSIREMLKTISRIVELVTLELSNRYLTANTMSLMIGTAGRYAGIGTCAWFARQPCHLTIPSRSGINRSKNWFNFMPDANGFKTSTASQGCYRSRSQLLETCQRNRRALALSLSPLPAG